jgi:alpha-tubulin suppressor-like RCC1 family protein
VSTVGGAHHYYSGRTVAIRENGTLWAWGSRWLGNGTMDSSDTPIQIGTDTDWVTVSSNSEYTVAIKNDGTLWAWGQMIDVSKGTGNDLIQDYGLSPIQIGTERN